MLSPGLQAEMQLQVREVESQGPRTLESGSSHTGLHFWPPLYR